MPWTKPVDIHNNTGHNPHYACVNSFKETHLHLARLFSRTVVYFRHPAGVQSAALATVCPAVTIECGRANEESSVTHAAVFINSALAMHHFPQQPVPDGDLDLMRTFAIIKVPRDASFSYDGTDAEFRLCPDLDRLNFAELEPGTIFGTFGGTGSRRLDVLAADNTPTAGGYFEYVGGEIRLSECADCLGYLMHRIGRDGGRISEQKPRRLVGHS